MVAVNAEIVFDRPNGEYYAGEALNGKVLLKIQKPTIISNIQVRLKGKGKVSWSESSGTGDDQKTTWYYNKEIYLDQQIMIYQSTVHAKPQDIGTIICPFSIILPKELPESFKSSCGNIEYKAKITVNTIKNSSQKKKPYKKDAMFIVHALVPVPTHLNEMAILEGTKNLPMFSDCCCCCSSGKISVKMITNKGGYLQWEPIYFQAEISNYSDSQLNNITVIIKQEVVHIAKGGNTSKSINKVNGKVRFPGRVRASDNLVWQVPLTVDPSFPPTNLGKCTIITVRYYIEIEIGETSGCCAPDVHFRKPFMLGSSEPSSLLSAPFQTALDSSNPQVVTQQPLGFKEGNITNYET